MPTQFVEFVCMTAARKGDYLKATVEEKDQASVMARVQVTTKLHKE